MGFLVHMSVCIVLFFAILAFLQTIECAFNYIEGEIKRAKRRKIVRAKIRAMRMQRAKLYSLVID